MESLWQEVIERAFPKQAEMQAQAAYWTIRESEYATDVMFADEASLKAIYPSLVNHAVQQFGCRDVMRFLGRRFHRDFDGEVTSQWFVGSSTSTATQNSAALRRIG